MTTATDYTKIAAFDLQSYVDSRSDEEKVRLFKLLGDYLQEKEADAMWLQDHASYPYSAEFMAWYVSNHYVALIDSLFTEPEVDMCSADIVFTYRSGRKRQVTTISNYQAMPYEYMLKMTMKVNRINPEKVREHLLVGWLQVKHAALKKDLKNLQKEQARLLKLLNKAVAESS